ncbi:hypothetical protein HJC02_29080 [Rhizobium sp. NLR4a]|uniref:hypothetical protein n=1 Tax=Rhizobium sp. NLR4a TaxID=2731117 RepID=UPI001C83EEAA|nr:hypothetical protein [Rhizobium sp. NLR4a]MBX5236282.1 hypothetical protein [Rhizobium sp. NLR4a]
MDRRTFIKGAVVAASTPATLGAESLADPLGELFERQKAAYAADSTEWDRFSDIIDSDAMRNTPEMRVRVGQLIIGRIENGGKITDPIYAYDEKEIRDHFAKHDHWTFFKREALSEAEIARKTREQATLFARMDAKIAEFHALEAEAERIKEECGYSVAQRRCKASSDAVKDIERLILDYVPATLEEASRKARWILDMWESSDDTYLRDDPDTLELALRSIARAAA